MPRITYIGPFDAVEVDGFGVVKHGDSIEVENTETAKSLLEQDANWSHDKKPAKTEKDN